MLKRYKQKCKQTKLIRQVRDRKEYKKPSDLKRVVKQKAIFREKIRRQEETD